MINSHYIPQFILRNFYDDGMITIEGTANMGGGIMRFKRH